MRENTRKICEEFIKNRDELMKVAKLENMTSFVSAANILTNAGAIADAEKMKALRKIVKGKVSSLSSLAGRTEMALLAKAYISTDPEATVDKTVAVYDIMKKSCGRSSYIAALAVLLGESVSEERAAEIASRGRTLYDGFKKKHPIITSDREKASACILAFSPKTNEQLDNECEAAHSMLKKAFSNSCFPQVCAHILCATDGAYEAKAERLIALFNALKERKKKYGKGQDLNVLAALSLADAGVEELADAVVEIEAFLSEQKYYGALYGFDEKRRMMNAAMLAANEYSDPSFAVLNIMAAVIALSAQQNDDDASTAAIVAASC